MEKRGKERNDMKAVDEFASIDAVDTRNYNKTRGVCVSMIVDNYICMERVEPRKQVFVSNGALYMMLLFAVQSAIVLTNVLNARFGWHRAIIQIALYALLLLISYLVYRYRLTAFRYTLTTQMLMVGRIIGKETRSNTNVLLSDIDSIHPFPFDKRSGKYRRLYKGRERNTLILCVCTDGVVCKLMLSPSEDFTRKLITQWESQKT